MNAHLLWILSAALVAQSAAAAAAPASGELLVKWRDGPGSALARAGDGRVCAVVVRNFPAAGWQLVRLRPGVSLAAGLAEYHGLDGVMGVEPNDVILPVLPPARINQKPPSRLDNPPDSRRPPQTTPATPPSGTSRRSLRLRRGKLRKAVRMWWLRFWIPASTPPSPT